LAVLHKAYASGGRAALIAAIGQRIADPSFDDGIYLLADAGFTPVAGNIDAWPPTLKGSAGGWGNFEAPNRRPGRPGRRLRRATVATLPDGSHLLVGKEIEDLDEFVDKMNTALIVAMSLIFVLAGVASVSVTRRTVGRIEAINLTSRAIMQSDLTQRIPPCRTPDEGDELGANLKSILDRLERLTGDGRGEAIHGQRGARSAHAADAHARAAGEGLPAQPQCRSIADRRHPGGPRGRPRHVLLADADLPDRGERPDGGVPRRRSGADRPRGRRAVRCRRGGQRRAHQRRRPWTR